MAELRIALLGPPRVELDGAPIEVDTRKAIALLAYLAMQPERHGRDAVAGLLWPDYDTEHARGRCGAPCPPSTRRSGRDGWRPTGPPSGSPGPASGWTWPSSRPCWPPAATTATRPRTPARPVAPLAEAAGLHRGDFLAGFSLRDSTSFDDWQYFQAERLRRELAGTLERLATAQIGQRHWDDAVDAARRWLALDPLHEPAHRQLMRIYAWSGRRGAALRQFQACQRVLEEELGVEPLEETVAVHEAIQANRLPPPPEVAARAGLAPAGVPVLHPPGDGAPAREGSPTAEGARSAVHTPGAAGWPGPGVGGAAGRLR